MKEEIFTRIQIYHCSTYAKDSRTCPAMFRDSTSESRKMYEDIDAGLIYQMSWSFIVGEDSYDRDTHTRTILKIKKVYDVSAVDLPANPSTEISSRSWINGVIETEKQELLERQKQIQRIKILTEVLKNA